MTNEEKLKKALLMFFSGDLTWCDIGDVACTHCSRRVDGKCLVDLEKEGCPQTGEEAIELFIQYGLE